MQVLAGLRVWLVLGTLPGETRNGGTASTRGLQRPLSPPSRALFCTCCHSPPPPPGAGLVGELPARLGAASTPST
eukprot:10803966-Alexandrium_andersonii.AAC.1